MKFFKNYCTFIVLALLCPLTNFAQAPPMGTAYNFAIFTSEGDFHNSGISTITGDIGTNAGVLDGFPPGIVVGDIMIINPVTVQASIDLGMAYADLATRTCDNVIGVTLGNDQILLPGVYCTGAASTLNGNLTLNGADDENSIFIFQVNGAFATTVNSTITLINGAKACNIYWQINGAFALMDNSVFKGNALINGAISLHTNSNLEGRALSTAGAVSTESVVVCAHAKPPTITCPSSLVLACAADLPDPDTDGVMATELCSGEEANVIFVNDVITDVDCLNRYSIERTYSASDVCGNIATCTQYLYVNDSIAPVITCPSDIIIGCVDDLPAPDIELIDVSENCGGEVTIAFVTDSVGAIQDPENYNIYRKYSATDLCGNVSYCMQTITINDNGILTINCPENITVSCAAEVVPADINDVTASAGCGGYVIITFTPDVITNPSCVNNYVISRTYTATDAAGNTISCTQTITVSDNVAPEITCPADINVGCPSSIPVPDINSVTTTDNCNGEVVVSVGEDEVTDYVDDSHYTVLRTYIATDACGNIATCIQYIVVSGEGGFSITCPSDVAVTCASEVPAADINSVVITGNCDGNVVVTFDGDVISNLSCVNNYTITRTYTATDENGNSINCVQVITVADNIAPVIICPANVTVSCTQNVPPADINSITATDNCGSAFTITVAPDVIEFQGCINSYQISRTYTATDLCGNSSSCAQLIIVDDNEAPVISTPPAIADINCGDDLPLQIILTATDNCGTADVNASIDPYTVNTCAGYQVTYRWNSTDLCENTSEITRTFQVLPDTKAPVITPSNPDIIEGTLTVNCQNSTPDWDPFPFSAGDVTATDACSNTSVNYSKELLATGECGVDDFISKWLLTWTATDNCGNIGIYTVTMNIVDVTPPVFINLPQEIIFASCSSIPQADIITAIDECGNANVAMTEEMIQGNSPGNYSIIREYKASTGDCDYKNYFTQTVIVTDDIPPVITYNSEIDDFNNGDTINIDCDYLSALQLNASDVTAIDYCGSSSVEFDLVYNYASDCALSGFMYNVRAVWRATDICGNVGEFVLNFKVSDHTPPVFSNIPENICTDILPTLPNNIKASDNCGSVVIEFEQSLPVQCGNGNYLIQRTWIAIDDCGNIARDSQLIMINNNPEEISFAINLPEFVNMPDSSEIWIESINGGEFGLPQISDSDILISGSCLQDNTVSVTTNLLKNGDCILDGFLYRLEWIVRVTDLCGNSGALTYFVNVKDETPPVLVAPSSLKLKCGDLIAPPKVSDNSNAEFNLTFEDATAGSDSCINNAPMIRKWKATDECGNETILIQSIYFIDDEGPVFTGIPADDCGQNVTYTTVTAKDKCSGLDYPVTYSENTFNSDCGTVILRKWTATDDCGNISVDSQRIYNKDLIAPMIKFSHPDLINLNDGNTFELECDVDKIPEMFAHYGVDAVTAKDNCGGNVVIKLETNLIENANCITQGYFAKYLYIWTATDPCGNQSTLELAGKFTDSSDPVFDNIPEDLTLYCDDELPAFDLIQASDCYLDHITQQLITDQSNSGKIIYNRIWTATDICGNKSTATQLITINNSELNCNIILPEFPVDCGSFDNIINSYISGGQGPYTYEWSLINCDGYISDGQGTEVLKVVNGYTTMNIMLKVTDSNGCISTCSVSLECNEGQEGAGDLIYNHDFIESKAGNNVEEPVFIELYPNPASDHVYIIAKGYSGQIVKVEVTDILGNLVKTMQIYKMPIEGIKLDLQENAEGIYLIHVLQSGREPLMKKIFVGNR